jgi:hypothetical protein
MAVFTYITFGGVVGPDIRKSIRFKDLIFGAFLFVLIGAYYTYKFNFLPKNQWTMYDVHILHTIPNAVLLQSLLLNRNAMTYWGQILRRWRNNLAPWLRGARVGLPADPMGQLGAGSRQGPGAGGRIPLVFTITGPRVGRSMSRDLTVIDLTETAC